MDNTFSYDFNLSSEVFNKVKFINDFSVFNFAILIILILFLFALNIYILPKLIYLFQKSKLLNQRKKKMLIIKQIALQKDIEDEIEKEIEEDSKRAMSVS